MCAGILEQKILNFVGRRSDILNFFFFVSSKARPAAFRFSCEANNSEMRLWMKMHTEGERESDQNKNANAIRRSTLSLALHPLWAISLPTHTYVVSAPWQRLQNSALLSLKTLLSWLRRMRARERDGHSLFVYVVIAIRVQIPMGTRRKKKRKHQHTHRHEYVSNKARVFFFFFWALRVSLCMCVGLLILFICSLWFFTLSFLVVSFLF